MRAERQLLRLGEYLVRRASRQLPGDVREERYREWAAELPAILHDPQVRPGPRRAARMLGYAADTLRGTVMAPGWARGRAALLSAAVDLLFLGAGLAVVAWNVWNLVQGPREVQNYLYVAWGFLIAAYAIRKRARPARRTTALLALGSFLALGAASLVNVAQSPEAWAWVGYFLAALILLPLLLWLPAAWWLRRFQAHTGERHGATSKAENGD